MHAEILFISYQAPVRVNQSSIDSMQVYKTRATMSSRPLAATSWIVR